MTQNDLARKLAKDFYEILGITSPSTPEEIKKQFRLLALKYHPDKNPDDAVSEAKFKAVNEAYAILGDELNKKMYDEMRMMMSNGFTSLHAQTVHNDSDQSQAACDHSMHQGAGHVPHTFVQNVHNGGTHCAHVHSSDSHVHPSDSHVSYASPMHNGDAQCTGCAHHGDEQHYQHHHHSHTPQHHCGYGCGCYSPSYHYPEQEHYYWGASGVPYEAPPQEQSPTLFDVGVTLEEILTGAIKHVQVTRSIVNPYTQALLHEERTMVVSVPQGVHQGQMIGWSREGEVNGFASHFIFIVNEIPHPLFVRDLDDVILRIDEESVPKDKKKVVVMTLEQEEIEIELEKLRTETLIIKKKGLPRFDQPDIRGNMVVLLTQHIEAEEIEEKND